MTEPVIKTFFDPATATFTHVVSDPTTRKAAIIDSVLDYDPKSGRTSDKSAQEVIAYVKEQGLEVEWILETHAHADHLSAAPMLRDTLGGKIGIGVSIAQVQGVFKKIFNLEPEFATDGRQFDGLFDDGDTFQIGNLTAKVWHVPGHTPADSAYQIGNHVFTGDTIFPPDVGTARCDFPGGDARVLFKSIRRILELPGDTVLHMCHDYPPNNSRPVRSEMTVAEQRQGNIHVRDGVTEEEFVAMRSARDATLAMPVLILPSVQINVRAGELPPPEQNGERYLKIPLNML